MCKQRKFVKGDGNMYVNLELELFRQDMTVYKLAKLLGLRETALYDKLNGKEEFKFSEAVKIKRILNTDVDIEVLFSA